MAGRKRGQNEGGIRKRADGRYEAAISLGWKAGKRYRRYYYGRTRGEVQQALTKALRDRDQGLPIVADRQTVAGYLTHWLEHTVKPAVRPRTYQSYELLTRLHVLPDLGKLPLTKVTPETSNCCSPGS